MKGNVAFQSEESGRRMPRCLWLCVPLPYRPGPRRFLPEIQTCRRERTAKQAATMERADAIQRGNAAHDDSNRR